MPDAIAIAIAYSVPFTVITWYHTNKGPKCWGVRWQ